MLNKLFLTTTMMPFFLLISIFSIIQTTTASTPAYTATELILLNCGASGITNDTSLRSWDGDERSRYLPSNAASLSSAGSAMDSSVFPVPFMIARFFISPFTYTFPISRGQKFLRLYFYPNVYVNFMFNTSQSSFSLTANSFTLFRNFSDFIYSQKSPRPPFMMEFIVNIGATQRLYLTFTPDLYSFAFVNGIEIVSIPDKLYFRGDDVPIKFVDQLFYLNSNTTLENLYRLNVGGGRVDIQSDSGPTPGMFRGWSPDDDYIVYGDYAWTPYREGVPINYTTKTPPYTAPPILYTSARIMSNTSNSLDWGFPVDSGFYYLLRFHFCEFMQEIRNQNERVFSIYINNQTAETELDVISLAGGPQTPIFRYYITWVSSDGRRGMQDLRLSLVPFLEGESKYVSALLNGLEIFKLNDPTGSFAAANPDLVIDSPPASEAPAVVAPLALANRNNGFMIYGVVGSVIGAVVVVGVLSFLIVRRRRKVQNSYNRLVIMDTSFDHI